MPATEHGHRFRAFGTDVHVLLRADAPLDALRVQALFARLHRTLSRFDPASELCALNERAGRAVAASPLLMQAVDAALRAGWMSGGLVDPTILDDLERVGYAESRDGQLPASLADALRHAPRRRPAGPRRPARWSAIEVDGVRGTIRLPAGVRLDLGGSAKGLAADLAAEALARHAAFAVDAGGDIRVGGIHPAPRPVRIQHPLRRAIAHTFTLTTGAVATSGLQTRLWRTRHGFAHHLIDPARGTSAWTGVIQATALAPTALEAESLAKTALLRGPAGGHDVLARHGGALVLDDGRLILAGGLAVPASAAAA